MKHADYPHTPGTLYDCPACESECFCADMNTVHTTRGELDDAACIYCWETEVLG